MKLARVSELKLLGSFEYWNVSKSHIEPMYNYIVHGYEPGSFFCSVLANDFVTAMSRSHPSNSLASLKSLSTWMYNCLSRNAWGSYSTVERYLHMDDKFRRSVLEETNLIYTPEQETYRTLIQ